MHNIKYWGAKGNAGDPGDRGCRGLVGVLRFLCFTFTKSLVAVYVVSHGFPDLPQ